MPKNKTSDWGAYSQNYDYQNPFATDAYGTNGQYGFEGLYGAAPKSPQQPGSGGNNGVNPGVVPGMEGVLTDSTGGQYFADPGPSAPLPGVTGNPSFKNDQIDYLVPELPGVTGTPWTPKPARNKLAGNLGINAESNGQFQTLNRHALLN